MDQRTARFTDRMGSLLEAEGFPPIAGRLFGLLLLRDDACSLDELAAALCVSKASVSTNARLLAAHGSIERTGRPGDRRDYYRVTPDLFNRMMAQRLARWQSFTEAVHEGRRSLAIGSPDVAARLADYEAAYAYMTAEIGKALRRWRAPTGKARRPRRRSRR